MRDNKSPTENDAVIPRVLDLYNKGEREQAISEIDRILSANLISTHEAERLARFRSVWSNTADPNYSPPAYPARDEFEPLWQRSYNLSRERQPLLALHYGWVYMQYTPAGTVSHQRATSEVIERAVEAERSDLAVLMAEYLLSHYALIQMAQLESVTPVGIESPVWEQEIELPARLANAYWPINAAIRQLEITGETVWVKLLELALQELPKHLHTEATIAFDGLHKYYLAHELRSEATRLEELMSGNVRPSGEE